MQKIGFLGMGVMGLPMAKNVVQKCDGDEGLFCAYDNVAYLAPVYAGDYIEAYGEIEKIGNTSRGVPLLLADMVAGSPCRPSGRWDWWCTSSKMCP